MNTWCSSASSTSDVNEETTSADLTSVATHTSSDTRLGKLSMSFSGHCIFTLYLFILFIPINVMELHLFSWHFSKRYCFAPLYTFDSYFKRHPLDHSWTHIHDFSPRNKHWWTHQTLGCSDFSVIDLEKFATCSRGGVLFSQSNYLLILDLNLIDYMATHSTIIGLYVEAFHGTVLPNFRIANRTFLLISM